MADLQSTAQLLDATLDPRTNKQVTMQAETALQQQEQSTGFSLSLLHLIADSANPFNTRLAAALCFKNFIKRSWTDEEGTYKLPPDEVLAIRRELIGLMISVPAGIQAQLGDAISVIADSDFWERWDTLVDDLVSRLTPDNTIVNNGVLQVAHSIFKRWRPLYRSDELYTEINHVLSKFGAPFLTLLENTDRLINENRDNATELKELFTTLNLMIKLFYDLSCQDLPPIFEENLRAITTVLHKYLTYDSPLLSTDDEGDAGPLELVKSGICEVLILYVQKFEDEFRAHLGEFVTSSWNLLTTIGPETKYDILVSKALQFLTAVTHVQVHAQSFNDEAVLGQVVEKVILPNLSLRESDVELFEDEPIEFIRRDLEGSDNDTRRRAATDFLRQLMTQFEELVTAVVSQYVDHYIAEYATAPAENWKAKDTAVYLFSSIAATGVVTASQGVKSTNSLVDVVDFFQKHIASDLVADGNVPPILRVDALKYLYTFRTQMTKQQWQAALPLLIKHLDSSEYVIYTYAAIAVERVLVLTTDDRQPVITTDDIIPVAKELLEHLFKLVERQPAPEKIQENEFLMKCAMRVLIVVKDGVVPFTDMVLAHLINITKIISENPSNPRFYNYHFESLGALIKHAGPSQPEKLETACYEPFATVLQKGIEEFTPYVFQLFAALLEANPTPGLSPYYQALIPPIIMPSLWEAKGNVPALVRLLTSLIPRAVDTITKNNQLEPILGIFQKLISSKANESYSFDLIEAVLEGFPVTTIQPYFTPMLNILLMRLQTSKSDAFALRFVKFYHFLSARDAAGYGADFVATTAEGIQAGIFPPLYLTVILPSTQKIARPLDRKTAVISLAHTLANSSAFADRYAKGWAFTCEALLKLLENPPLPADDALVPDAETEDLGFGVDFTQLNTTRKAARDPWPEVRDVKAWVGAYLKTRDGETNGKIAGFVQQRLSEQARAVLSAYMQAA